MSPNQNRTDRAIWALASVLYGVCIGFVAIEFPSGSLVALVFLVVYGFAIVGSALYRRGAVFTWGTRPVLQYFLLSYIVAFCITIAWVIYTKSVFINRSQSGLA